MRLCVIHLARIHYERAILSKAAKWQNKAVEYLAGMPPPEATAGDRGPQGRRRGSGYYRSRASSASAS